MTEGSVAERDGMLGLLFGCSALINGADHLPENIEKTMDMLKKCYKKSYLTSATSKVVISLLHKVLLIFILGS